jgi:hypothetical protein
LAGRIQRITHRDPHLFNSRQGALKREGRLTHRRPVDCGGAGGHQKARDDGAKRPRTSSAND